MTTVLHKQSASFTKNRPDVRPGFTVRVHERIQAGNKERVQVFEGLVISVHKGHTPTDTTFTVRRIVSGVGVEKVYSLHSPKIEKIDVKKVAKVRRAKLFFLRGRRGKSARLSERFTTADEFAIAAPVVEEKEEEVVEEAPKEEAAEKDEKKEEKAEEVKDKKKEEDKEPAKESASAEASSDEEAKKEEKKEE